MLQKPSGFSDSDEKGGITMHFQKTQKSAIFANK